MTQRHGSRDRHGSPKKRLRRALAVLALVLTGTTALGANAPVSAADDYDPIGWMPQNEGSGLVASRTYPGVFWALRDSGSGTRTVLYAFKVEGGRLVDLTPGTKWRAVSVLGARNVDWEGLAIDWDGNLWIGDIGNNSCTRTNVKLYQVAEPNPYSASAVAVKASYPLSWPDPAGSCTGYNAEGLFYAEGSPYVISKSSRPGLYRPTTMVPGQDNRLQKVADLTPPAGGFAKLTTSADLSPDGSRLVVTTAAYEAFVYEAGAEGLHGPARLKEIVSRPPRWSQQYARDRSDVQVEGAAFTLKENNLLLLSESRSIRYFPRPFYES